MKIKHRVLSMLLALALVFSLLPAVNLTVAEAAAPAGIHNHLPSTAKDIKYLSDMTWEKSVNHQNNEAIKDGVWSNGGTITIGRNNDTDTTFNNTTFTKGLGVMAKGTSSTDTSYTVFDLADNNYVQSHFYAAAALTNASAINHDTWKNYGVVFEVWASYDKTVEDYTKAEYTLLESSGKASAGTFVTQDYIYQFHVDVTGARYLKLVVYGVNGISGMNSVWAGACVYNNPGYYPKSDLMGLNNKQNNNTWVPTGNTQFHTYHINDVPSDAVYLSGSTYKNSSNGALTSKATLYSASGNFATGNRWFGGVTDVFIGPDASTGQEQREGILASTAEYLRFNAKSATTAGYAIFDVSGLNANRFYAMYGSGNQSTTHKKYDVKTNRYAGIVCQVWGAQTKDGTYTLLSESEPIVLCNVGEFFVDITGYNFLRLTVKTKNNSLHNGMDVMFYRPCVFTEWDVAASGAASVMQGTSADFTTTIRHDFTKDYTYPGTINWAVAGAEKPGTKIDANGKLSVDPYETATELKVTASLTEGGKTATSKPVTVAVSKAPVYTLDIEGPAEAGKNTEQTITSSVTKDGQPDSYDKIDWTLTGATDAATKIEDGKLTIGNEPVGTKLTVKASFTEYGILHEDTVEITIAAYGLSVSGNTEMAPAGQLVLSGQILNEGQPVAGTVNWSVTGAGSITPAGNQVVVTSDGTVGKIKVTATWTTPGGSEVSATHEISVNAYTIDVSSAATAVSKGSTLPISAIVKKNGEKLDNADISWKIVNLTTGAVTDKTGASVDLQIHEDAGTILVITATAQFGGMTVSDSCTVEVTNYSLTIDPTSVTVEQGDTTELKATLSDGTNSVSNPVITWNVSKSDGSSLNINGDVLSLTANDAVGTELTVIATAVVDGETIVSAPAKVTVIAPIVYTVTLDKATASVKQGEGIAFTAVVTRDGTPVDNPVLTWSVSGALAAGTTIDANGNLTVDSQETVGTKLNVTAVYEVGGKVFTSAASVVTVEPAPIQDAFSVVTGTYETLPANAIYLADDGVVWIESVNDGGKPAIKNGAWKNGAAIWIGGGETTGGTHFNKGIGVQPQAPNSANNRGASWTTIDISTYDCDTFYAAVGGTNASNQQNGHNSFIYQVFGATDQNGPFTLMAESTAITRKITGEFKVDITGVKYLKLVIKCTDTGNHGYGNSVWANAAIYKTTVDSYIIAATGSATTVEQGKDVTFTADVKKNDQPLTGATITWNVTGATKPGTKIDATGKLTVDKAEPASTVLSVTASIEADGTTYTSAPVTVTVTEAISESYQPDAFKENTSGKYEELASNVIYLSDVEWIESVNNENKPAIRNGAWKNGAAIWIGGTKDTGGTNFLKGIGVQPQEPNSMNNRGASWTTIDISSYNCDVFYAAVGGTNVANQQNGHNSFIYQVYGATEKGGEFVLLAQSAPLTKTQTGEFKVNVKNIKILKLVIKCTDTGNHGYGNSVWANAAIYDSAADSYTITATGSATEVQQGKDVTFTATVSKNGTEITNPVLSWTVIGGTKTGTKIDANGKLTVANDEPAGTELTVVASSVVDGETLQSTPVKVTVVGYTVTLGGTTTSVMHGESATFTATVSKNGAAVADPALTWTVTGATKPGTKIENGKLTVDKDEPAGTKLSVNASVKLGGVVYTSETIIVTVTSTSKPSGFTPVTDGYASLPANSIYLSDVEWIESVNLGGVEAIRNGAWQNGAAIWIGGTKDTGGTNFLKGIGVQPQAPTADNNRGASWTTIDISNYNCDVFYAAVGGTNVANQQNGHNSFIYQVYGATEKDGEFALLAQSAPMTKTETGEFSVDIKGVKVLKLVIKCADTGNHGFGNSVWANAAIYDSNAANYTITATGSAESVQQGKDITFTASVAKDGKPHTGETIVWAVTGNTKPGTKIDANGKLTADKAEPIGTVLSVNASIEVDGITYTSETITVIVTEPLSDYYQEDAFEKNTTGKYATLASNVTYLSDVDWIESVNLGGVEAIRNGVWQNGAAIWIGGTKDTGGTNFIKGIGVQPQAPTADNNRGASWTTIDISGLGCDTFYAAVGGTNVANQQNGHNSFIYQVYGATEKDGEFVLLAQSEPLTKTETGEFKVNVKDMKVLKLVVKCAETGNHGYGNSMWANAAVYDSTADSYIITATTTKDSVQQGKKLTFTASVVKNGKILKDKAVTWTVSGGTKDGTKINSKGRLTVDKAEPVGTVLSVTASIKVGKVTYTSVPVTITVTEAISEYYQKDAFKENTTGKYAELANNVIYLSDVDWVESVNLGGAQAIRNGAWQNGAAIWIGGESNNNVKDGTEFKKGIGVQPQAPNAANNRGASWTTIDVSKLGCDTFYAVVGGTNAANQEYGHNSFIYQVYGTTEKDGEFLLLAESQPLTKTQTGEFKIDITDIVLLQLVIKCTETGNHGYGNSVWANACVYNKDGSDGNMEAIKPAKPSGTPVYPIAYNAFAGTYLKPTGKINFLSDMEWVESVNLDGKEAIRNGAWQNGAAIWIGGTSEENGGKKFVKGLGVQAQAPTADNNRGASWTTFDISGLNCDTFYAVVGGTNASNQQNGHNSFIYQVYGATEKDGTYKLIAQSEPITKTMTGEFKVDITGVNFLKLVIKCTDTGNHGYGNSVWANACVFNSETGELVEDNGEVDVGPTAPTTTKPNPTEPTSPEEPDTSANDGNLVIIIAAAAALLIAIIVTVIVIIKKKRR